LSPSDDLIQLDTDKKLWNRFEACSTVEETQNALDSRTDKSRPVLFYAQPMNVHQFANNDVPGMNSTNWRIRPDFNNRIAYEVHWVDDCMGRFVAYLKTRGMYDNSIVILTSDHGDATGQFGRFSHSLQLYPEVLRVPLIVHLPKNMRDRYVYDDSRISVLTDITPSLYYLLGHRPVEHNPLFGRPLFAETKEELESYRRGDLFVASDVRAVYGILAENGRYLYMTYDSPPNSLLFDLARDPNAEHSILTDTLKKHYDEQIIQQLQAVGDLYGYKPGVGSMLASAAH
jgi:arylsulfatase A-like enzyme